MDERAGQMDPCMNGIWIDIIMDGWTVHLDEWMDDE